MKINKNLAYVFSYCLFLHLSSVQAADVTHACTDFSKLQWLIGDWQSKTDKTLITESWQLSTEHILTGKGVTETLRNDPTSTSEYLNITKIADEIFYTAKPPQNDYPIAFKLKFCHQNSLKFENTTHDFPQFIEYTQISEAKMIAKVSSENNPGFVINFERNDVLNLNQKANTDALSKADIVQLYVDAYNQKNLTGMMKFASQDIKWMSIDSDKLSLETTNKTELISALKQHFARARKSNSSLSELIERGRFVSTVEKSTAKKLGKVSSYCSLSVYEFSNKKRQENLIKNVWYYAAQKCS